MSVTQLCVLIWVFFTLITGYVAFAKNRSILLWLVLGFLFGAFALAVVALLPDRTDPRLRSERREPFVPPPPVRPQTYGTCPGCGRVAFSANDAGDYYCYACGETVQVVARSD